MRSAAGRSSPDEQQATGAKRRTRNGQRVCTCVTADRSLAEAVRRNGVTRFACRRLPALACVRPAGPQTYCVSSGAPSGAIGLGPACDGEWRRHRAGSAKAAMGRLRDEAGPAFATPQEAAALAARRTLPPVASGRHGSGRPWGRPSGPITCAPHVVGDARTIAIVACTHGVPGTTWRKPPCSTGLAGSPGRARPSASTRGPTRRRSWRCNGGTVEPGHAPPGMPEHIGPDGPGLWRWRPTTGPARPGVDRQHGARRLPRERARSELTPRSTMRCPTAYA